ncbi:cell division ATP-binding protein FtsE [Alkalibacterium sp. f15]|uniref:cell division ATP-binding protein FtsE n=1 Tax=Alkalibacterium sp. f15 TaxID=3414029 RepID=UPI003BF7B155
MIRLKNVFHKYDTWDDYTLKNISCDIEQGEFIYLTGASESGKTTFLKMMCGDLDADKGFVGVQSYALKRLKKNKTYLLKRQVGAVFRDYELLEYKTVYENVAYVLEVTQYPVEKLEQRVLETLAMVGLKYKALDSLSDCSVEERRRIAIARAMVNDPRVLIVDEITLNLNAKPRINMLNLLHKINKLGTTVIMATQELDLIDHMPSRMIELDDGAIKSDRSKNHILLILSDKMGEYYIS